MSRPKISKEDNSEDYDVGHTRFGAGQNTSRVSSDYKADKKESSYPNTIDIDSQDQKSRYKESSDQSDEWPSNEEEQRRERKIFISHSHKDAEHVKALVNLLLLMGVPERCIFCSSYKMGVPLGMDIYIYLKQIMTECETFVIYMLSRDNYYSSAGALNEMGAAWVLGSEGVAFLLPGMHYSDMKGALQPSSIQIEVVSDDAKYRLNELRDMLRDFLGIGTEFDQNLWEQHRDDFLSRLNELAKESTSSRGAEEASTVEATSSPSVRLRAKTALSRAVNNIIRWRFD